MENVTGKGRYHEMLGNLRSEGNKPGGILVSCVPIEVLRIVCVAWITAEEVEMALRAIGN